MIYKLFFYLRENGISATLGRITFKLLSRLNSPGELLRPSLKQRNRYINLRKVILFQRKKNALSRFISLDQTQKEQIDSDQGFLKIDPKFFKQDLHELGRSLYSQFNIKQRLENIGKDNSEYKNISAERTPIITIEAKDINKNQHLLKFLTNKNLITVIANYLKIMPWLYSADIWISHATDTVPSSSQNFHMDWEDHRIIKLFLFLDEITDEHGPLSFVNANNSKKVINYYKERYERNLVSERLTDEQVYEVVDRSDLISLTGPRYTTGLVDTCNVLHYGSRPSKYPRIMLSCMFASPFSIQNYIWQRTRFSSEVLTDNISEPWSWVIKH
jgi:hypothetical protein